MSDAMIEPPPSRFAKAAQERWHETPEEVRVETLRAIHELTAGFAQHRAAALRDAELAEFHSMASAGGTTVKEALTRYVQLERLLRSDPDAGIAALLANLSIDPHQLALRLLQRDAA